GWIRERGRPIRSEPWEPVKQVVAPIAVKVCDRRIPDVCLRDVTRGLRFVGGFDIFCKKFWEVDDVTQYAGWLKRGQRIVRPGECNRVFARGTRVVIPNASDDTGEAVYRPMILLLWQIRKPVLSKLCEVTACARTIGYQAVRATHYDLIKKSALADGKPAAI